MIQKSGYLGYAKTYVVFAACTVALLSAFSIGRGYVPQRLRTWSGVSGQHGATDATLDTVMNETLGFQKIFVLNLKRQTDRRDSLTLAAAFVGVKVEVLDGVTDFDMRAAPVRAADQVWQDFNNKTWNSWRAHVNAIRAVVEQNLTSALIMEDDADFDVHIKEQMKNFARSSRLLLQPLQGTSVSLDPTNPRQSENDQPYEIDIEDTRPITLPTSSPYGDIERWDILWLGHCGISPGEPSYPEHPLGRVVMKNDPTAIQPQHYLPVSGDKKVWPRYPNNTRLVFQAISPRCNLAYAINRQSARKLLYQLGIKNMTGFSDSTLHKICNGDMIRNSPYGYTKRNCIGVQPTLFGHHFAHAYPRAYTENVRYGARANFDKLVDGDTDYHDAFPDGEPMALYFHHVAAKARYEQYLIDPEPFRRKEEKARGVLKAQQELDEQERRGHLAA